MMTNGSTPYNITFTQQEEMQPNSGPIAGVDELLAHHQPTYWNPPRYQDSPFGNASNKCPSRKNKPSASRKQRQQQMPKHKNGATLQSQGAESEMHMSPSDINAYAFTG